MGWDHHPQQRRRNSVTLATRARQPHLPRETALLTVAAEDSNPVTTLWDTPEPHLGETNPGMCSSRGQWSEQGVAVTTPCPVWGPRGPVCSTAHPSRWQPGTRANPTTTSQAVSQRQKKQRGKETDFRFRLPMGYYTEQQAKHYFNSDERCFDSVLLEWKTG